MEWAGLETQREELQTDKEGVETEWAGLETEWVVLETEREELQTDKEGLETEEPVQGLLHILMQNLVPDFNYKGDYLAT